jgi:hypothetical protein
MGQSITNLLEFLGVVFHEDMDVWSASSSDEEAIRAIARDYPPERRQALLSELDSLLSGARNDAYLLAVAQDARVSHPLDEANVREWFAMIREQLRLVVAAS